MVESHLAEDHYGWVGEEQLRWFAEKMAVYEERRWLRLALVHHNPVRGATDDDENLRDASDMQRHLAPLVNVLFHGHTHNGGRLHYLGNMPVIATGSAGVVTAARPHDVPNQYQIVRIYPDKIGQFARIYKPTEARWLGDNSVSVDGSNWRAETALDIRGAEQTFAKRRIKNVLSRASALSQYVKSSSALDEVVPHGDIPVVSPADAPFRGLDVRPAENAKFAGGLIVLKRFFAAGTAESEKNILKDAFVTPRDYAAILAPQSGSPLILAGKKGSGKSALLRAASHQLGLAGIPSLMLKPVDINVEAVSNADAVAGFKAGAYRELVKAISGHVRSEFANLIENEDDARALGKLDAAKVSPATLRRAIAAIGRVGANVVEVDVEKVFPVDDGGVEQEYAAASLSGPLRASFADSDKVIYILIDDTDQLASAAIRGHLNRIWGFLLAVRDLAGECANVKCILTLRSEIWRQLESDRTGAREQLDHIRGLLHLLNPDNDHIQQILERRLELASRRTGISDAASPYEPFFEGHSVTIPTSEARSSWPDFLLGRARGRPRDVIQLVSLLAKLASDRRSQKITSADVAAGMVKFSQERAQDISAEVGGECPQFYDILTSFEAISFKSTTEQIRAHLGMLPSTMGIRVRDRTLSPQVESDMFVLWALLFEVGFLNARVSDVREKDGFRHVNPADRPGFVSKDRWNEMQAVIWEVNPAYRDFLLHVKDDKDARRGLPPLERRAKMARASRSSPAKTKVEGRKQSKPRARRSVKDEIDEADEDPKTRA